ncbi:MAG TPA: hypothetical protein DCM14_05830 [Clostridiales bacterium UBA8153]|nr:hypothetical protein [Clostridiales bacterium UBA8153]
MLPGDADGLPVGVERIRQLLARQSQLRLASLPPETTGDRALPGSITYPPPGARVEVLAFIPLASG